MKSRLSFLSAAILITASLPAWSASSIDLYRPTQRSASFDACKHLFPAAKPVPLSLVGAAWQTRGLCSDAFAVLHSGLSKTPLVVVERLNRAQLVDARGEDRTDKFYPDPRLPSTERSHPKDYKRSGFSRGHLAAAGNAPTPQAMAQTFALSNMVPQDPINNSKVWNKLEDDTRKYAMRAQGDVFVFSGPLFDKGHGTIGRNQVYVPTRLFKLVYDQQSKRAWAHVVPNRADAQLHAPMDYKSFVSATGLKLLSAVETRP